MRISIIIIIAFLYNLPSYSQNKEPFKSGRMYKLYGQITDKTTKDTLSIVNLEFMDKDYKRIKATVSDFDGMYFISFCSNLLKNDTLLIEVSKAYYKEQKIIYKINTDTIINISMTPHKNKIYTKKELLKFERGIGYYGCGVLYDDDDIYDEMEYEINEATYRHYCSGVKKKYRSIIDGNEDISEWILIEE
ncbi:hypothetical protein Celal_3253 [Cellulophaga algicola DSM 14237]|uniref:Carboxypeptidase-like regulatory domain-containing protein n=1 Tax=Cellulophaga algicola (strain DSM 14237 / IC166 / ACAM 630) TaxID=688270 RepID=E6X5G7_CELAD|nr:hypothetical protein [Cellulophaga algicola]ADV50522.1 hypothetical protein Celal_3253 [Cellulophaga algicola DSM 14237]